MGLSINRLIPLSVYVPTPFTFGFETDWRFIVCVVFLTHKRRLRGFMNYSNQADNSFFLNTWGQIIGLLVLYNRFILDLPGVLSWMGVKWTGIHFVGFSLHRLQMDMSHGKRWSYKDQRQMVGGVRFQEYMDD